MLHVYKGGLWPPFSFAYVTVGNLFRDMEPVPSQMGTIGRYGGRETANLDAVCGRSVRHLWVSNFTQTPLGLALSLAQRSYVERLGRFVTMAAHFLNAPSEDE
jgi:hypothetical protein